MAWSACRTKATGSASPALIGSASWFAGGPCFYIWRKEASDTDREAKEWMDRYYRLADTIAGIMNNSCNSCTGKCNCKPEWGEPIRYNCPFYEKREEDADDRKT